MAAVIGELAPDLSRFHTMIANPSLQQPHPTQHHHHHSHESARCRSSSAASHTAQSPSVPRSHRPKDASAVSAAVAAEPSCHPTQRQTLTGQIEHKDFAEAAHARGASQFPSPPPSSSPSVVNGSSADNANCTSSMAPRHGDSVSSTHEQQQHLADPAPASASPQHQQPSPPGAEFLIAQPATEIAADATSAKQPLEQTVVHIRDLAHIQSLARADALRGDGNGILSDPPQQRVKYEISAMPIGDVIEMVAALLTKITATNDLQHDAMQRNATHQQQANQSTEASGSSMSPLSHSVLAFHGKNVPAITILSYLSRIHKYCPTTYEVFLSLLVYFDRMTERVNDMVQKSQDVSQPDLSSRQSTAVRQQDTTMRDEGDGARSDESDSDLADEDDDDDDDDDMVDSPVDSNGHAPTKTPITSEGSAATGPATYFVVDSFNIHRLIISGVTCSSKFFSDVFYTNSRYAKVGGLPLAELNHLELQFLVLNDFRLAIPVEDLEGYATMLVEFYARETASKMSREEAKE